VKKSVVAADCVFGSGVKISNSLILRGAVVHDGAQIQGCIVGPGAVIGARVTAKDSIIGAAYEVEEDADLDAETVVVQNK
jgi:translation initiation factor eIF-2B subunit gamma